MTAPAVRTFDKKSAPDEKGNRKSEKSDPGLAPGPVQEGGKGGDRASDTWTPKTQNQKSKSRPLGTK